MKFVATIAIFVLLYFTAYYLLAPTIDIMWKEGLIPGDEATWRIWGGLLRTIPAIVGILLTIPVGIIADRYGISRVFLVLGLVMGGGLIAIFASLDYATLLAGFTIFGVGMGCIWAPIMSLIAEVLPVEKRGLGYGVYYASTVLGFIVAVVLGVLVYWRVAFASIGAIVLALTVLIYATLPPQVKAKKSTVIERPVSLAELKRALNTALVLMLVLVLLWGIPWGTITTYAVDYLVSAWGIEKAQASLLLVISAVSIIIGHLLGGTLADRGIKKGDKLARVKLSILSVFVGLVVMLAFVLYPYPFGSKSMTHLIPPLLLGGFGMLFTTLSYPNINAVISEMSEPSYRTTVFAFVSVLNSIGWNIGPTLYGGFVAVYTAYLNDVISALKYAISSIVIMWIVPLLVWISMYRLYPKYTVSLK